MKEGQTIFDFIANLTNVKTALLTVEDKLTDIELIHLVLNKLSKSFDNTVNMLTGGGQTATMMFDILTSHMLS